MSEPRRSEPLVQGMEIEPPAPAPAPTPLKGSRRTFSRGLSLQQVALGQIPAAADDRAGFQQGRGRDSRDFDVEGTAAVESGRSQGRRVVFEGSHEALDEEPVEVAAPDAQAGDMGIVGAYSRRGPEKSASTIFKEQVEDKIAGADPGMWAWLHSSLGALFQGGLCGVLVFISVYETVFKQKASAQASSKADPAALVINAALFSLFLCIGIAFKNDQIKDIFNQDLPHRLLKFAVPGVGFALCSYIQILILGFLPADIFKVLEQSRLLVTACLSMWLLGKKQSTSGWTTLVVITLAALSYSQMSSLEGAVSELDWPSPPKNKGDGSGGSAGGYTAGLFLTAVFVFAQALSGIASEKFMKDEKHVPFYIQKFFLEFWAVICGLTTSCLLNQHVKSGLEKFDVPKKQLEKLDGNYIAAGGPFVGWDNPYMVLAFIFFLSKSWCSGYIVKQFSSVTKQLCSTVQVGFMYFVGFVHMGCPSQDPYIVEYAGLKSTILKKYGSVHRFWQANFGDGDPTLQEFFTTEYKDPSFEVDFLKTQCKIEGVQLARRPKMDMFTMNTLLHCAPELRKQTDPKIFLCPSNVKGVTLPMVFIDLCLVCAVYAFSMAGRDKAKRMALKKQLQQG